jgi:hypothetical protein
MKKKQYYITCGHSLNPKNPLQQWLWDEFRKPMKYLTDDPDEFEKAIERLIKKGNEMYPRCKPESVLMHPSYTGGMILRVGNGTYEWWKFDLKEVKGDFSEEGIQIFTINS